MKRLILLAALLLAACGGGGTSAPASRGYAVKMMVRLGASAPVPPSPGFDTYGTTTLTADPAQSVALQASAPGDVMLMYGWIGKDQGYASLPQYLAAARQYANVRMVYVFDELFSDGATVTMGAREQEVLDAVSQVHAAGLQAATTFQPAVLMSPDFKLADINAFDLIGVDPYPTGRPAQLAPGCAATDNPTTDLLACSIKRLRAAGYTGRIAYVFQAFYDSASPGLAADLKQQQQTIAAAPALGASWLVSFGYWDDTGSMLQPSLYPGHGSPIDALVNCSWGC